MPGDDYLSLQEVADAMGPRYRTMLAKVRRGELPAAKSEGKPYRLRRADVDAFIERSRVKPGQLASAPLRIPPRREGVSRVARA